MHDQLSISLLPSGPRTMRGCYLLRVKDSNIREITGIVRGPYSDFAKTLTADFTLKSTPTTGIVERSDRGTLLLDAPLPFWYDLRLSLTAERRHAV